MNTALYKALTGVGADEELAIKAADNMPEEMATKTDIAELRMEIAESRMATKADITEVRTDIDGLRTEIANSREATKKDFDNLREATEKDFANSREATRADIAESKSSLMRVMIIAMSVQTGVFAAVIGALAAMFGLLSN